MLKFGVIGAGKIARYRHLPEILMNIYSEVHAVCDIVDARAVEMAQQYDCKAYTNYLEIIQDPDVDAVVVAATNATHAEMSIAALMQGKHVLCEKPMATTLGDAHKMLKAAEASGKQLMIAHNQRLEPAHIKAKQILQSGKLGEVLSFTSTFGHPGCEYWAIDGENTWFFKKEHAGLGVLGDLAIHKLDLMRYLLDDNYTEAFSTIDTLAKTYPNGKLIDVEDNATCLLRTEKGIMGTIITSWTYKKEDNSTRIYAEKGVLNIYTDPEFPLAVHYDHQTSEYHQLGKQSTNVEQVKSGIIDAFVNALITGKEVPIPGIEGLKALEAALACQQASQTGARIVIGKKEGR
jgi:UDP-N-acetylglucosamine 3-dehydrogenase